MMVVKKHAIPYASLHKKTYFNALEKILISPRILKGENKSKKNAPPPTDLALAAFDEVIKKPPSRFGDALIKRSRQPSKRGKKANESSAIKFLEGSGSVHFDVKSNEGADDDDSDVDS